MFSIKCFFPSDNIISSILTRSGVELAATVIISRAKSISGFGATVKVYCWEQYSQQQ